MWKDEGVLAELAGSPFDHVRVDAAGLGVTGAEIRGVFSGFEVDKVRARACAVCSSQSPF